MNKFIFTIASLFVSILVSHAQYDPEQIAKYQKQIMQMGDTVGIFACTDAGMQQMIPINYEGMKANAIGTALTYGIAKTKVKAVYTDSSSPFPFAGTAHFRMYFGIVPANKAARYYMFSESYSIRDFSVVPFKVKKNKRELTQASYSLWGGYSSGVGGDEDVKTDVKQVRDGVYDIFVTAPPGEYCFVFTMNGVGIYNSVFDFSILE